MSGNHGSRHIGKAGKPCIFVQQVIVCAQKTFHGRGIEGVKHENDDVVLRRHGIKPLFGGNRLGLRQHIAGNAIAHRIVVLRGRIEAQAEHANALNDKQAQGCKHDDALSALHLHLACQQAQGDNGNPNCRTYRHHDRVIGPYDGVAVRKGNADVQAKALEIGAYAD